MSFTCISCRVMFRDPEVQRQHYKSDWHRYNLKRKVVDLPPVTAEDFQKRVLQQRVLDAEVTKDHSKFCDICGKVFANEKSFDNHVNSKRHKLKLENTTTSGITKTVERHHEASTTILATEKVEDDSDVETDSEVEEVSSDEWNDDDENNPINRNDCLFCTQHSKNTVNNLKHMTEIHSFFIPDIEYCTDLRGLLLYLGVKITKGFMCLWCNEKSKSFQSVQAARKHMIDKGHCKMLTEGEALAEFADFYDYSSSYPDKGEGHDIDEELDTVATLDDTEFQLVLPSGTVVGHRSLMKYYKQSLNPNRSLVLKSKLRQVINNYQQFGYSPLQQEVARRKARDVAYMRKVQQKSFTQLGCKSNKLQKHFRPQVNF